VTRAAIGAVLLGAFACGAPRPADPRPDVWLISVDTLRADRLGFAGHPAARTANLDRLAGEGAVCTDAQTPVPRTTQSLASIFTSQYPWQHGVRRLGDALAPEAFTLAEILHDAGWATAAVSANGVAGPAQGLDQGFDAFTDAASLRARYGVPTRGLRIPANRVGQAEATTREALRLLAAMEPPRFLWAHYMDPHFLYQPPAPFDEVVDWSTFSFYRDRLRFRPVQATTFYDTRGLSRRWLPQVTRLYDAEIAYVDRWIGPLLEAAGPDTLVVFTSDHGESLGEHGYYFEHGDFVYGASMAIPLVFRWPGRIAAGARLDEPVSSLDILPTLLGLLGLAPPDPAARVGVDLGPRLRGAAADAGAPERIHYGVSGEALLEGNPRRVKGGPPWTMVRSGRWKLVRAPGRNGVRFELYDLATDPGEARDLAPGQPERVAALAALLDRGPGAPAASGPAVRPEVEAELRGLGYVE
jgi:arylsulfatase A-like enzyme